MGILYAKVNAGNNLLIQQLAGFIWHCRLVVYTGMVDSEEYLIFSKQETSKQINLSKSQIPLIAQV